jgi:hypothetical protein
MTIDQAGKKRISNSILDNFGHNKPSELYPNTLPYIFFKDLRIYIPHIFIYTLRDNLILLLRNKKKNYRSLYKLRWIDRFYNYFRSIAKHYD